MQSKIGREKIRRELKGLALVFATLATLSTFTIDKPIRDFFHQHQDSQLRLIAWLFGRLGRGELWLLVGLGVPGLMAIPQIRERLSQASRSKILHFSGLLWITLILSTVIVEFFKHIVGRARPSELFRIGDDSLHFFSVNSRHFSFPSGHAQTVWCGIAILYFAFPKQRVGLVLFGLLGICGRVVMLRHFVSDVFAGATVALCSALVAEWYLTNSHCDVVVRWLRSSLAVRAKRLLGHFVPTSRS